MRVLAECKHRCPRSRVGTHLRFSGGSGREPSCGPLIGKGGNMGITGYKGIYMSIYIYMVPPPSHPQNLPFDEDVSIYLSYIYIYIYVRIYVEFNVYAYPLCGILPFQTNFISI